MRFKGAKRIAVAVVAVLLAVMLLLSATSVMFYASADSLSNARAQYNSLEKKVANLQKQIKENESKVKDKQAQSKTLKEQISTIEEQVVLLNSDITKLESEIATLNKEVEEKEAEISQNTDTFKYRLRAMYMTGGLSNLEIMMGADNFADFLTRSQMLRSVSEHDKQLIDSLKSDLADIGKKKTDVEAKKKTVEENRAALQSKYSQLESASSANEKLIVELKQDSAEAKAARDKYMKMMDDQQAEINRILEEAERKRLEQEKQQGGGSNNNAAPSSKGYLWPLPGYSMITSPFGYRNHPIYGVSRMHTGIDISGGSVYGKPIVASRAGTVITATSHYSYGNYVIISHGDGYSTLYAHCSRLNVSVGQTVSQGQTIAFVGNSGDSTGPHLHFEVRKGTTPVNPLSYVNR